MCFLWELNPGLPALYMQGRHANRYIMEPHNKAGRGSTFRGTGEYTKKVNGFQSGFATEE